MQESPDMENDDQKGSWSDELTLDEPEKKNHVDDDNERKIDSESPARIKPAYDALDALKMVLRYLQSQNRLKMIILEYTLREYQVRKKVMETTNRKIQRKEMLSAKL